LVLRISNKLLQKKKHKKGIAYHLPLSCNELYDRADIVTSNTAAPHVLNHKVSPVGGARTQAPALV